MRRKSAVFAAAFCMVFCLLLFCASGCASKTDTTDSEWKDAVNVSEWTTEETQTQTQAETVSQPAQEPETQEPFRYRYTLCFAGDVSLADGSAPLSALNSFGLDGCFDKVMLEHMRQADVMCLNSEFSFTRGGTQQNKTYTFRADPALISVYEEMGVDVAILANNHVYDYGEEGLTDTLNTFREAGIPYVGAGENIDEASSVWYAELDGCTVAYIAGCRVEWAAQTRGATEELSGVFRTAESTELICEKIAEAKENADFVVVYIHWGQENTTTLESYQLTSGREFIDAGADVVVGDHPHVLQGIEWYQGKPIFYSLGNYWFSSYSRYTMLLEVDLEGTDGEETQASYRLVPAMTGGGRVSYIEEEDERRAFYDYMEGISDGVIIDDDGMVIQTDRLEDEEAG